MSAELSQRLRLGDGYDADPMDVLAAADQIDTLEAEVARLKAENQQARAWLFIADDSRYKLIGEVDGTSDVVS